VRKRVARASEASVLLRWAVLAWTLSTLGAVRVEAEDGAARGAAAPSVAGDDGDTRSSTSDAERRGPMLRLQPPPPPTQRDSQFGGELHLQLVLPLAPALCPRDERCLLNGGFGIGGSVEQRWAFGGALLLGYDLSLLDAEGSFEVSTLHTLRVGARWVVPLDTVLQPYAEFGLGAVLFGDSFGVATAGAALQLGVGGELELTPRMALTVGAVFRAFTTGAFRARADDMPDPRDAGANFALLMQAGILLLDDPVP
jgi:hypothetical protein